MKTITVEKIMMYGIDQYRPVCDFSKQLVKLAGKKTFNHDQLKQLKDMDFEVILKHESLEL